MKQETICTYIYPGKFQLMGKYTRCTLLQSPNTREPRIRALTFAIETIMAVCWTRKLSPQSNDLTTFFIVQFPRDKKAVPEGGEHTEAPARLLHWEWSEPSVVPDSFRVLHTQDRGHTDTWEQRSRCESTLLEELPSRCMRTKMSYQVEEAEASPRLRDDLILTPLVRGDTPKK